MNTIHAPAGQRTVIRTRRHSSMVTHYHFTVQPAAPGGVAGGTLEVLASQWIFPGTPKRQPLESRHTVTAGMWNTFFEIAVIPETDTMVAFTDAAFSGSPKAFRLPVLITAAVLVVVIAAAALVMGAGN